MKENPLSLQASLTPENFPQVPATYEAKSCFAFREWREHGGSFLSVWEVRICCRVRLRTLFVGGYVSRVYLARVPLTSNIHPMRNDTWVVPYNISFPMDYALCRGAIQRERPANYPALRPSTNLTHFYPVAERNGKPLSKSRSTGFGSEQPEFAAWNTATPKSAQTKRKREKPLCDEGLEGS